MPKSNIRLHDVEKLVLQGVHDIGHPEPWTGRGFEVVFIDQIVGYYIAKDVPYWWDDTAYVGADGDTLEARDVRDTEGWMIQGYVIDALGTLAFCGLVEYLPKVQWPMGRVEHLLHTEELDILSIERTIREGAAPVDVKFHHNWCRQCVDRLNTRRSREPVLRDSPAHVEAVLSINAREAWTFQHPLAEPKEAAYHPGWRLTPSGLYAVRNVLSAPENQPANTERTPDAAGDTPGELPTLAEWGVDSPEDLPVARRRKRMRWLAEAMLLVRDHPGWSDSEIARRVGKAPSTVTRSPEYRAAASLARGQKTDLPKGHVEVDPDSGQANLEAYDE